ncbi:hypothetical protein F5Y09DRAFT_304453 [Xylaria sp. FL1042]|nr:hypothetical protein F5Y09DRAFT_304453 [Xylaria sp. FL1042]
MGLMTMVIVMMARTSIARLEIRLNNISNVLTRFPTTRRNVTVKPGRLFFYFHPPPYGNMGFGMRSIHPRKGIDY